MNRQRLEEILNERDLEKQRLISENVKLQEAGTLFQEQLSCYEKSRQERQKYFEKFATNASNELNGQLHQTASKLRKSESEVQNHETAKAILAQVIRDISSSEERYKALTKTNAEKLTKLVKI